MVLTLNLIFLISRKALVPFEFDVHLRAAPRRASKRRKKVNKKVMKFHLLGSGRTSGVNESRKVT